MKLTIKNGDGFTQIGIPYEGKQLSLTMHILDVISHLVSKPIQTFGWDEVYQFEIWDSNGLSSWLVVNRNYVGDNLEVYWVDEVMNHSGLSVERNVGDVFKIGRGVVGSVKDLTEYMCYRYVNRTQIVGKPVSVGTNSWA